MFDCASNAGVMNFIAPHIVPNVMYDIVYYIDCKQHSGQCTSFSARGPGLEPGLIPDARSVPSFSASLAVQVHDVVVDTDVVYNVDLQYSSMYATMSQHFHDYNIVHNVDYNIVVFCLRHCSSKLRYCSIHYAPRSHCSSCLRYRSCYNIGNPDVVAPNYDIVVTLAKTRYRETLYRSKTTSGNPRKF